MFEPKTKIITDPRAVALMHATGLKALGPFAQDMAALEKKVEELFSANADLQNQLVLLRAKVTKLERDAAPAPHLSGIEKR